MSKKNNTSTNTKSLYRFQNIDINELSEDCLDEGLELSKNYSRFSDDDYSSSKKKGATRKHKQKEDLYDTSDDASQDTSDDLISYDQAHRFSSPSSYHAKQQQQQQQQKLSVPANPVITSNHAKVVSSVVTPAPTLPSPSKPHSFGPNTHEIRGFKIDYDGVSLIEKVDGAYNGYASFGIKFSFKGSRGLSRTVWFGRNVYERDRVYKQESSFWSSLPSSTPTSHPHS